MPLWVLMFPIGSYKYLLKYKVLVACFHKPKIPFLPYCNHVCVHCDTATHSAYSLKLTAKTLRWLHQAISSVVIVLPERQLCKANIWPIMSEFSHLRCWTLWKKLWFITEALVPGLILTRTLLRQCYQECALLNWFRSMLFSICILKLLSRDLFL